MSPYETVADLVEVRDPAGHRHFLPLGSELPDWVDTAEADALVERGAVMKFGVI